MQERTGGVSEGGWLLVAVQEGAGRGGAWMSGKGWGLGSLGVCLRGRGMSGFEGDGHV